MGSISNSRIRKQLFNVIRGVAQRKGIIAPNEEKERTPRRSREEGGGGRVVDVCDPSAGGATALVRLGGGGNMYNDETTQFEGRILNVKKNRCKVEAQRRTPIRSYALDPTSRICTMLRDDGKLNVNTCQTRNRLIVESWNDKRLWKHRTMPKLSCRISRDPQAHS